MGTTQSFKSYQRGTRYQSIMSTFGSGMMSSRAPITEGFSRTLVNCELSTNNATLKPRKGLVATGYTRYAEPNLFNYDNKAGLETILAFKECYINNETYGQFIIADASEHIGILTTYADKTQKLFTGYYDRDDNFIPAAVKASCNFKAPLRNIHNMEVTQDDNNLIGTFINDQYFFFNSINKCLMYTQFNEKEKRFELYELKASTPDLSECAQAGFNMLLDNPYSYIDRYVDSGVQDTITFAGMACYKDEACTEPAQYLIKNTTYYYRVNYTASHTSTAGLTITFDWTTAQNINWQTLSTKKLILTEGAVIESMPLIQKFRAPADEIIIRCTATTSNGTPVDVTWNSFKFENKLNHNTKEVSNFSLHTAKTITYWNNRIVVANVDEDPSYLFMSNPEQFEYFPFPNQADYLEEPIIAVKAFMDYMLVFTKSKLYQYTIDDAGGYTRKCIQNNLTIKPEEINLIQIVKNMVYFKSGNYYFMVVPRLTSTTGELTIAPISKNIQEFFDNFDLNVQEILSEVYDIKKRLPLCKVYNFLDYESVYNIYSFKALDNLYINLCLLYNTVKRGWSIHTIESCGPLYSYKQDSTRSGEFICLSYTKSEFPSVYGVKIPGYQPAIQYLEWSKNIADRHYGLIISEELPETIYKNIQYLDTGLIDINSNLKKRFREIQFRINNNTNSTLKFSAGFFIDGITREPLYIYTPVVDTATNTMVIMKTYPSTSELVESTKLGSWNLNTTKFPGIDVIKTRIPVSGKGYNGQIKLICQSEKDYELLDISTVYRLLYSR